MRLAFRVMFGVFLVLLLLVTVDGLLSVSRESELFDRDMREGALVLGHAVETLVVEVWRQGGEERALELVREMNRAEHKIGTRWVWLDAPEGSPEAPLVSQGAIRAGLATGITTFVEGVDATSGRGMLYAYVPVSVPSTRPGALELAQPLELRQGFRRRTIVRVLGLSACLVAAGGLMLWLLGSRIIAQPLERIVEKTRSIGQGDFTPDLELQRDDELGDLADAINRMCMQLSASVAALRSETEQRVAALEQLRHSERLATIGRLASGVAHELGTPLNVVGGRAKIIATDELTSDELVENARIIAQQADRMSKIVRQLLDYARRRKSRRDPVPLTEVVRGILELVKPLASKAGVTVDYQDHSGEATLFIDKLQVQQALLNIAMNAIQAMPSGGRLELESERQTLRPPGRPTDAEAEYAVLHCRDQGSGITPEDLTQIFEPFFSTKEPGHGTGLGLSICQGIIEDHGGWIGVESTPGRGSRFSIYFPSRTHRNGTSDPHHRG